MVSCLARYGVTATTSVGHNGRTVVSISSPAAPPTVKPSGPGLTETPLVSTSIEATPPVEFIKDPQKMVFYDMCRKYNSSALTETERRASRDLVSLVNGCLARSGLSGRISGDIEFADDRQYSSAGRTGD